MRYQKNDLNILDSFLLADLLHLLVAKYLIAKAKRQKKLMSYLHKN